MEHTKGPWYVREDREFYHNHRQPFCIANHLGDGEEGRSLDGQDDDSSRWICRLMDDWSDEYKANARLIAAAPDMLSALRAVKPMLMYPQGDMETWIRIVDAVNAAIAKAEGGE